MSIKEQICAEIEWRLKNIRDYMTGAGMKYKGPKYYKAQGKESAYDALLNILDTLPEQPASDFCKENCKGYRETGKCFIDCPCVAKQSVEGLEEEIQRYFDGWGEIGDGETIVTKNSDYIGLKDLPKIARHFAEWGAEHLKK